LIFELAGPVADTAQARRLVDRDSKVPAFSNSLVDVIDNSAVVFARIS
jgi:hypothetical protein